MKPSLLLIFFIFFVQQYALAQQTQKDTAYVLFNTSSTETCTVDVEGKGYQEVNKFRKEDSRKELTFFLYL